MPGASLSTAAVARKNIRRRPWRSFCLVVTVLLFSMAAYMALFLGTRFGLSRKL